MRRNTRGILGIEAMIEAASRAEAGGGARQAGRTLRIACRGHRRSTFLGEQSNQARGRRVMP